MEIITLKNKISWKRVGKWLLLVGWLLFIYAFSAQRGKESLDLSNHILDWFQSFLSHTFMASWNWTFLIRKGAHLSIYFILGILAFSLVKEYHVTWKQCILLSFLICMIYACMDELHQLYVEGRDGRILDVFIDSFGSLLSISLFTYFHYFRKSKTSN